jgi:hypothetical protein
MDSFGIIELLNSGTLIKIYCSDGPLVGTTHTVKVTTRKAYLPLPRDRFYKQAVYFVSTQQVGPLEFLAVFSYAVKR